MKRILIVGAGISGLSLAWILKTRTAPERVEIAVLERRTRPGGNICSRRIDGYLCESAASGFLDSAPATLSLVRELGLAPRLVPSREAARRRFVYRGGELHPIPGSPRELLCGSLLSWPGKLRLVAEPLSARRPLGDETIYDFAVRRLGSEAARRLVDPLVSGILAGDARQLSLRACFPRVWQLETEHGGLLRALLATRRRSTRGGPGAPAGRLTSFVGGMGDLTDALHDRLAGAVLLGRQVAGLEAAAPADGPPGGRRYLVDVEGRGRIEADAVVLTGSAGESARLLRRLDPSLAADLERIPTAPLAVLSLGYDAAAIGAARGPLDGYGFVVPRDESPRILGVVWESSIYPGRAPDGKLLLRVLAGGARDPEVVDLTDTQLLAQVRRDLAATMRIDEEPEFVRIVRHRVGLPQYTVGHLERLAAIEHRLARHPGLFLGGNSYRGVSVNACIAEAAALADRVLSYLAR